MQRPPAQQFLPSRVQIAFRKAHNHRSLPQRFPMQFLLRWDNDTEIWATHCSTKRSTSSERRVSLMMAVNALMPQRTMPSTHRDEQGFLRSMRLWPCDWHATLLSTLICASDPGPLYTSARRSRYWVAYSYAVLAPYSNAVLAPRSPCTRS